MFLFEQRSLVENLIFAVSPDPVFLRFGHTSKALIFLTNADDEMHRRLRVALHHFIDRCSCEAQASETSGGGG